jgi:hypothetical protein
MVADKMPREQAFEELTIRRAQILACAGYTLSEEEEIPNGWRGLYRRIGDVMNELHACLVREDLCREKIGMINMEELEKKYINSEFKPMCNKGQEEEMKGKTNGRKEKTNKKSSKSQD